MNFMGDMGDGEEEKRWIWFPGPGPSSRIMPLAEEIRVGTIVVFSKAMKPGAGCR